jgi:hypothetical protein
LPLLDPSVLHRDRVQCSVINTPNQPVAGVCLEILMDTTALKMVDELGLLEDQIDALPRTGRRLEKQNQVVGCWHLQRQHVRHHGQADPREKDHCLVQVALELKAPADLVTKYTTISYNLMAAETKPLEN